MNNIYQETLAILFMEVIYLKVDSDKIFYDILSELKELNRHKIEDKITLDQMAEYLKDYQSVIDFQIKNLDKGIDRKNQELMHELKLQITKAALISDPDLVGAYRGNKITWVESGEDEPVYVNNKSLLIQMAQNYSTETFYNRAYYRIGYLKNVSSTAYDLLNENVTHYMTSAQNLTIKSSSTDDTGTVPVGKGIQQLILSGLNSSGIRFNETILLNGTTAVTTVNKFSQIDGCFAAAVGATGCAAGTISVTGSDTNNYAVINIGENQWKSGLLFTDSKAVGYVDQWTFGGYNTTIRANLTCSVIQGNFNAVITRSACIVTNESIDIPFPVPLKVPKQGSIAIVSLASNSSQNNEAISSLSAHLRLE